MASSDDFREQLKIGNIREALAIALSDATELKITTWVASQPDAVEETEAKPGHRLRTRINLIEGAIENEIGDQFIANGRFRELRQFHLEQVADSNKIIKNNLKSLQKLFEVLVAMRYQSATPSVIEPELPSLENHLLPPSQKVAEAGLAIAPQEPVVEGSILSTDTVTHVDIPQEPLPLSQEPGLFATIPTDSREALDSEADEDDWDDSVLDLLESLPVAPQSNPNALDSQFDEDPRNLIEEQPEPDPSVSASLVNQDWGTITQEQIELPTASPEANIEALSSQLDDDPRNLIEEESEPESAVSNLLVSHDSETPTQEDLESPPTSTQLNIEGSNAQLDDDWGDLIEEEPEPEPSASNSLVSQDLGTPVQEDLESPLVSAQSNIEASNSRLDDDWGWEDWVEEEPEPNPAVPGSLVNQDLGTLTQEDSEPPLVSPEPNLEASNVQFDDDWGDLIEEEPEPSQGQPIPSMESLELEEDEDWDDWVVEEPEPLQNEPVPVSDLESLDLGEDEDWGDLVDDSNPFVAAPTPSGSVSNREDDEDWDEFAAEELEPYSAFIDVEANTVGTRDESSDSLEDLTDLGIAFDETENPDLSENLITDSSTEKGSGEEFDRFSQIPEKTKPSQNADRDLMGDLFGEPEPQQTQSDPTKPDNNSADAREETLLTQMQFDEFSASLEDAEKGDLSKESDPLAVSEHDLEVKPKPIGKRVPPPPPPSRFPNQNN
jgi:hypothetical protein